MKIEFLPGSGAKIMMTETSTQPCFSYTAQKGLPYFDCATDTANGNWYYDSVLEQNLVFVAVL